MTSQWKCVCFSDVATIGSGLVDPRVEPYLHSLYIGPENIESETGNVSELKTAAELKLISGKFVFGPDALVYSKIRPNLNKLCFPGFPGICSADAYVITARAEVVDRGFLLQLMRSRQFVDQAVAVSMRTGMPKINQSDLNCLAVPLPPLGIQKQISVVLSAWDRAIRQLSDLIAAKVRFKQALMQQLLTGKRRFSAFHGSHHVHATLGDVIEKIAEPIKVEPNAMYREIGIRSHGKGIFHKDPVTGQSLGNKRVYPVIPGCLTLNIVFALERALAVTTEQEAGMIASHRFPMFRAKRDRMLPEYALHYLLSQKGTEVLHLASPGGAGRNRTLSQTTLLKASIRLPPIDEQRQIVEFIEYPQREIELLKRQLDALMSQKKGLMQKLLTGQVRVKLPKGGH